MIYLFDFDDTLWSRNKNYLQISIDNIKMLNKLKNVIVISGNTFESIKPKIELALGNIENCTFDIWADANTTLYRKGKPIFTLNNLVLSNYDKIMKDIKKLNLINKTKIIKNKNGDVVNIKIKPLVQRNMIYKKLKNIKFKVIKAGQTTIDILHKKNDKIQVYKYIYDKKYKYTYIGDEVKKGNDKKIARKCDVDYNVKNVYDTYKFLKKKTTIGLIIAAGNQSRFDSDTPKALVPINNTTLLDLNIKYMKKYCDKVYVVCSYKNKKYFKKYNTMTIKSGYGCGDAVLKALNKLDGKYSCIIKWGDSYHDNTVYKKILYTDEITIPVRYEDKPYVQIKTNGHNTIKSVSFSKYNDKITSGYHDLSIFYGNINYIRNYLQLFANKILVNNEYKHKHNNELQFLDVFNETDIKGNIQILDDINDYSFNTIEELNKIEGEIK